MRLIYFASLRERIGKNAEEVDLPPQVRTIAELIAWLAARDEAYAATFADTIVRAAIDKKHAKLEASVVGAREIAFFPPMTGG
ncbi:molybdopterin converting factor subunit 1 [Rhodoblastus acidophilus]|uniref:Molybdopterin converting factor subunit 1 n=1 Tax=Candidatus Rhodoblastus alkanivorans TaxID=2954117 RepID=A0ABS9Z5M1_9HYPH|nr:molybdopterin converting factor subunit 1 [Candidatus Rhodoblastus alkanivorans]MCI4680250.1 molybdopterin converting factor subunit 1 [Candidatus Rhodoblastus alkanivorans]MCI4682761.1 molybdopterin converting factor subunit 1 [Candidatus Rhodoblastus alkanivorans]MDI4640068.1 molybdopterin converting factor subunit 1 [Rhodoblastus acidophilus]